MYLAFTKEQFHELLALVHIGGYVRGAVRELADEYDPARDDALENTLYQIALTEQMKEVERYDAEHAGPTKAFEEECHAIIETYEDDQFWHELETRLGQRDFTSGMTEEEKKLVSTNGGWLPERIQEYYETYAREFETFGLDRLVIDANAPASDPGDTP